jgi:hypothetical protein
MPKTFRPWNPEQTTLLTPSPSEWLSDDLQMYFMLDLLNELDFSEILAWALQRPRIRAVRRGTTRGL